MNTLTSLSLLCRMQFASMRWFWRSILVNSFAVPASFVIFWRFANISQSASDLIYFLAGNVVVGLLMGNMSRTASRFAFLRETGALDYYATLLVNKTLLILAVTLVFLFVSLPGTVLALLLGTLLLDAAMQPHVLLVPALVLGSLSLSTLGAVVGVYSRSLEQSFAWTQLFALALMILSPVLVPVDRLPLPLQMTSLFVPTSYTVRALRSALVSDIGAEFVLNMVVLLVFSVAALWLVHKRLEWRS